MKPLATAVPPHAARSEAVEPQASRPPAFEDAIAELLAPGEDALQRRGDVKLSDLKNDIVAGSGYREIRGRGASFKCLYHKKVSPQWLWRQTENKLDYLLRGDTNLPRVPKYSGTDAGLQWLGWQNDDDGAKWGDWVDMTVAWATYAKSDTELDFDMAKELLKGGLWECPIDYSEGLRTSGFIADFVGKIFLLEVENANDEKSGRESAELNRAGLVWQTPKNINKDNWDTFVENNKSKWTELGLDPEAPESNM